MKILLWRLGGKSAWAHLVLMRVSKTYYFSVMRLRRQLVQMSLAFGHDYECFRCVGVASKPSAEALTDHLGGRQ